MGRFQAKEAECDHKEYNKELNKQIMHGLDDKGKISGILREVSALEDIDDTASEMVLLLALRVVAQRVQKNALNCIRGKRI